MNIKFRRASLVDVPILRDFESKLVAYERTIEPTLVQEGKLEYYDIPKIIKDTKNSIILIAEIEGRAFGCGLAQIKENDVCYNQKKYGYIGLMYVDSAHRGKNIGSLIIQELVEWIRGKGIKEVRLKVYSSNDGAIKAYKKYGFDEYIQEMKLDLGEGQ